MPPSTPPQGNPFGEIIDLSDGGVIAKASRGATKEFEAELVSLLSTMTATHAIAVTGFVVDRDGLKEDGKTRIYPATDEGETAYKNERQRIGAVLRSHAEEAGLGKVSLNWHPVGNYPQVSLKG